jgi:hypothetical protein
MIKIANYAFLLLFSSLVYSQAFMSAQHEIYIGVLGGYGSTNWSKIQTDDPTLQASLPSHAKDAGLTWGVFIGDNIGKHYGVELRYQKFANSAISFAKYNEYAPAPDFNPFTMTSKTENYSLLGKLRVMAYPNVELYSILGASYTKRSDTLAKIGGLGGVFGGGTTFVINSHFSNALEFDFITGNASITLMPSTTYQPFLTSLSDKFIYTF